MDPREEMMADISARQNARRAQDNGYELPPAEEQEEELPPVDDEVITEDAPEEESEALAPIAPPVAKEPEPVVNSDESDDVTVAPFVAKLKREDVDIKETLKGVVSAIEDGDETSAVDLLEQAISKSAVTEDDINEVFAQKEQYDEQQTLASRKKELWQIEQELMAKDEYKEVFEDPDMFAVASRKMKELNGKVPDSELFQQSLDYTRDKFGLGENKQETTRLERKASAPSAVRPRNQARKPKEVVKEKSPEEKRADLLAEMRSARGQQM